MKMLLLASALLSCAVVASAQAQEAKQNFTLVNKTGYEIKEVFVSPNKSSDWEEDVLGEDTLADDDQTDITFKRSTRTCNWDLKVVYSIDDTDAVWSDINLCKVDTITIRYNKKTDTTSATFD